MVRVQAGTGAGVRWVDEGDGAWHVGDGSEYREAVAFTEGYAVAVPPPQKGSTSTVGG